MFFFQEITTIAGILLEIAKVDHGATLLKVNTNGNTAMLVYAPNRQTVPQLGTIIENPLQIETITKRTLQNQGEIRIRLTQEEETK